MSNQHYDSIHAALIAAEHGDTPTALTKLSFVLRDVNDLLDEQLATAVLDDDMPIAAAGKYAGLTENAVGPRLARTRSLSPYVGEKGRVTAEGIKRARHDQLTGTPAPPIPTREPLSFKSRRPTTKP